MNSDTPRTDNLCNKIKGNSNVFDVTHSAHELASFARTLERELDQSKRLESEAVSLYEGMVNQIDQLHREGAEMRDTITSLARWCSKHHEWTRENAELVEKVSSRSLGKSYIHQDKVKELVDAATKAKRFLDGCNYHPPCDAGIARIELKTALSNFTTKEQEGK